MSNLNVLNDRSRLQTLTEDQVAARLAVYNPDGGFERDLRELWDRAGEALVSAMREWGGEAAARQLQERFEHPVNAEWIHTVAEYGKELHSRRLSIPRLIEVRARLNAALSALLFERLGDDLRRLGKAVETLQRLRNYEIDIVLAQIALLDTNEAVEERSREAEQFEGTVAALVTSASERSAELKKKTEGTAKAARGMLEKTNEVAAAAEQSAQAMRDAAETAAGLIIAIQEARNEVEDCAKGVAARAGEQAFEAVLASRALSSHVEAIESILGLIRSIAGQTKLLAINATIEAARAGVSGRGFAVVAQEVKSLASQTAHATDDITTKIAAIQQATRETVQANESIRGTVDEMQGSAERIRRAMEMQAQTVTMITAAVDETALAADSMSSTIATIRADTQGVASEVDEVERSFSEVDEQMTRFKAAAGKFIRDFVV